MGQVCQPLRAGRLARHRGPSANAVDLDAGGPREPRGGLVVRSRYVPGDTGPIGRGPEYGDRHQS